MTFLRERPRGRNEGKAQTRRSDDRGMLIPIVLIGMFIFVLFFFTIMRWNSSNRRINFQDIQGRKALCLARGAAQLALLKVAMLPTECYDALAVSQLKNPYFSIRLAAKRKAEGKPPVNPNPKSEDYNPGPSFLTLPGENRESMLSDPKWVGTKDEPLEGALNEFVKVFASDIRFHGPDTDDVTAERKSPYVHGFRATKVKVLAVKDQVLYNRQTVELTMKAWVVDGTGTKKEKEYTQIVEVERK